MARPKGVKDQSPTAFANRSSARARSWADKDFREKQIKAIRRSWNQERREKQKVIAGARWADPEYRARVSAKIWNVCNRPAYRELLSRLRRAEYMKKHRTSGGGFTDLVRQLMRSI